MPLILEGLLTTLNEDQSLHLSPMGPEVDATMQRLILRPYQTSTTFANLLRTGAGIFHVVDDVELLARAVTGQFESVPEHRPATRVPGNILLSACRWYAFRVERIDDRLPRAELDCLVAEWGRERDFFGFNRAKHAVVEAAILASRTAHLPIAQIRTQMAQLRTLVDKTAGVQEQQAFELLERYIEDQSQQATSSA